MQKITTCLWFDNQAEEAVNFYTSIFKNSKIGKVTRFTKEGFELHQKPEGSIMTIDFQIEGQDYLALNGGPIFQFNESISIIVNCETQEEIDYYWNKLSEGGDPNAQQCGWLKDKFGLSWQIVPNYLTETIRNESPEKIQKTLKAMFTMKKMDIAALKEACG